VAGPRILTHYRRGNSPAGAGRSLTGGPAPYVVHPAAREVWLRAATRAPPGDGPLPYVGTPPPRRPCHVVAPPPPRYQDITPGRHEPRTARMIPGARDAATIPLPFDARPRVPLGHGGPHLGFPVTPALRLPSPTFPGETRPPPPASRSEAPQLRPSYVAPQRPCWFSCGDRQQCRVGDRCWDLAGRTTCAPDLDAACKIRCPLVCFPPGCTPGQMGCTCGYDSTCLIACSATGREAGRPRVWCE
jgi:hypothetical protein